MKTALSVLFAALIAVVYTAPSLAAKPEKVLLCHYGEEAVLDEAGDVLLDENGEPVTEIVTSIIRIPEKAANKHIEKHGDVPLQTGDDEADAQALADCTELLAEDDDEVEESEVVIEAANLEVREISLAPVPDLNGNLRTRSEAGASNDDLETPADVIHPNIHANNGPGNAACPGDQDHCQNMHGIGNNPGQSGDKPNDDGVKGFANELNTVHGGIGAKNKNAQ